MMKWIFHFVSFCCMSELEYQKAADRLLAWEAERQSQGKRAPASPQRPDLVSLKTVEAETGISSLRYNRSQQRLRVLLEKIVERLGGVEVEWDRAAFATGEIHLELCRALCTIHYERECAESGNWFEETRKILDRLFTMLVRRSAGGAAAPAKPALKELRRAVEKNEIRDGAPLMPYLDTALDLVEAEQKRKALPEGFADRLRLLVGRAGLSRSQAARRINVNQGTFNSWCTGAKMPDRSQWPRIEDLEDLLELKPGTLLDAITPRRPGAGRIESTLYPFALWGEEHAARRAEIARQMPPDFFERPLKERMELLALAATRIEDEKGMRQSWYDVRHHKYKLDPFPAGLESEWTALVDYKSGRTELSDRTGAPILANKMWCKESTLLTYHARIAGYLGFRVDQAPPDLQVQKGQASLLHLADAEALLVFLKFKHARAEAHGGVGRITKSDLNLLTLAGALLSPLDGFLRFSPPFREGFLAQRQRFGMVSPSEDLPVAERQRRDEQDLSDICDRLLTDIKRVETSFRGRARNNAEHRARMEPLLSLPMPLQQFYAGIEAFQAQLEMLDETKIGYWRTVRAATLLHLLAQHPMRRSMLAALNYLPDNSGHLRYGDKTWYFIIPVDMFKNASARQFEGLSEVRLDIEDVHGAYEIINLYISEGRATILRGASSDALFVSTQKSPRFSAQALDNLFQALFTKLTGPSAGQGLHIPGMRTMPIHGMRDLIATAILKASGSYQTAADSILDSESTLRRAYARYKPSDRLVNLKAAIRRARGEADGTDQPGRSAGTDAGKSEDND